jgi:hypothetical protein
MRNKDFFLGLGFDANDESWDDLTGLLQSYQNTLSDGHLDADEAAQTGEAIRLSSLAEPSEGSGNGQDLRRQAERVEMIVDENDVVDVFAEEAMGVPAGAAHPKEDAAEHIEVLKVSIPEYNELTYQQLAELEKSFMADFRKTGNWDSLDHATKIEQQMLRLKLSSAAGPSGAPAGSEGSNA